MIARLTHLHDRAFRRFGDLKNSNYIRDFKGGLRIILSERVTKFAFIYLCIFSLVAVFGEIIAPFDYSTQHFESDGSLKALAPPMTDGHILGTNHRGQDVFSRLVIGARPTFLIGFIGGTIIITIGTTIGVTAGYLGGTTESALMRFTDFAYGVPLIPFAIVLVVFIGVGFWITIFVIGIILWRGSARVLRSQVLQIKQRPYIEAAKATGASTPHIVFKHILPNIASMIILFFALGVGVSILVQANLAFIGVADPFVPSWGIMIRNSYQSGYMAQTWWWSLPPGILISLTVLCSFMLGRGYESVSNRDTIGGAQA